MPRTPARESDPRLQATGAQALHNNIPVKAMSARCNSREVSGALSPLCPPSLQRHFQTGWLSGRQHPCSDNVLTLRHSWIRSTAFLASQIAILIWHRVDFSRFNILATFRFFKGSDGFGTLLRSGTSSALPTLTIQTLRQS